MRFDEPSQGKTAPAQSLRPPDGARGTNLARTNDIQPCSPLRGAHCALGPLIRNLPPGVTASLPGAGFGRGRGSIVAGLRQFAA